MSNNNNNNSLPCITPDLVAEEFVHSLGSDPARRRQATERLEQLKASVDQQSGFVKCLIAVMTNAQYGGDNHNVLRLSAATMFKNTVKATWNPETSDHVMLEQDKSDVRANIFDVVLNAPRDMHHLLEEALYQIARVDFPGRWPELPELMIARLGWCFGGSGGQEVAADRVFNAMRCASAIHSVMRRYREDVTELTEEIAPEFQMLHDKLCRPLLACVGAACAAVQRAVAAGPSAERDARVACQFASYVVECVHDLVFIDCSDLYVDLLPSFARGFADLLSLKCGAIEQSRSENEGSLADVKIKTLALVTLHVQKYAEEVRAGVPQLASAAWNVLEPSSEDNVVIGVIQLLEHIARSSMLAPLLKPMVQPVIDKCIMPNVELDDYDVEMFEDEPADYIEHDIEGSDQWTRRRAATELVRALLIEFANDVAPIFKNAVQSMLARFHSESNSAASTPTSPKAAGRSNWKRKDGAIFLVTALATRGTASSARGTVGTLTSVYSPQELMGFFTSEILPELQGSALETGADSELPTGVAILKASAIRFVSTFRRHLGDNIADLRPLLEVLALWLPNPNMVVFSYAAHAIDRLLSDPRITPDNVLTPPLAMALLQNLCMRLQAQLVPNEHLMRALAAVLRCTSTAILTIDVAGQPLAAHVTNTINHVMTEAMKNPSNAQFTHFLYESLAWTIRHTAQHAGAIEQVVWGTLLTALQQNIIEMMPYSLQIVAQLLDAAYEGNGNSNARPGSNQINAQYLQLLQPLLSPAMLADKGNVPAVVRLAASFLRQGGRTQAISGDGELVARFFAVATELMASKATDTDGFALLVALMVYLDDSAVNAHVKPVLATILNRLQNSKTLKFERAGILGVAALVAKYGGDNLAQMLESMQQGLFPMFLRRFIFRSAPTVTSRMGRKCSLMLLASLAETLAAAAAQQGPQLYCECVTSGLQLANTIQQQQEDSDAFRNGRGSGSLRQQTGAALTRTASNSYDVDNHGSGIGSGIGGSGGFGSFAAAGSGANELMSAAEGRTAMLAETGFTNSFCPLQGAQRDPDDPFPGVEQPIRAFLDTVRGHMNGPNGSQFTAALQSAIPPEAMRMLA